MSQQFAESLHKQYVGVTIGWVQITALQDTDKGALSRVIALCLCKCQTVFQRKLFQLVDSQRRKATTASCGCFRKHGMREKLAQAARQRQQLENSMTEAERQQVQRILDSRTYETTATDRREAIECVIRDRQVGDLLCHGGDDQTL
jgi:hypothetical protein